MRKRSQLARRRDAVREDLARVEAVPRLQKVGRLLLAQSSRIAKGAVRALLDDWEEGGQIEIVLDPSRSAKSHAEDCFAKARRLQRGEPFMRRRLDETERLLERAETVRAAIEAAHETAALGEAVREAERFGIRPGETGPNRAARAERASRKPFTRYRGVRERAILVGRGGADNDALTTRHARPHDLWLHAKNIAGAHVIVPLEKGTTCPPDLLVDAATLAGHFSDARGEGVVEVSYVERRYVRKPRGSAPGAVTFDHEKVIAVRMDAGRVERLLATRED
jgi:predicted ribosome quality control (RQC) complex YloA/Tae2 family protein